jgi:hypothetical protein
VQELEKRGDEALKDKLHASFGELAGCQPSALQNFQTTLFLLSISQIEIKRS